jgi:hypothetical protein
MLKAAEDLQFEKAALLRDQIKELKHMLDGALEMWHVARTPDSNVLFFVLTNASFQLHPDGSLPRSMKLKAAALTAWRPGLGGSFD